MKVKYRQEIKSYGCGLFAVANALDLANFVTEDRLQKSKEIGDCLGRLSKYLQDDGHDAYIDTFYYNHNLRNIPKEFLNYTMTTESSILPVLFNIILKKDGTRHLVGGHLMKNGVLHIFDNLKEDVIVTNLKDIKTHYYSVFGMFMFNDLTGVFLILKK